jgi:hypothetical protein
MFKPGDMVECVDATPLAAPGPHFGKPCGLSLGGVYTVSAFYPKGAPHKIPGHVWGADFVDLHEVAHPDPNWAFVATRFKLLKRHDPGLLARLLGEPAEADLLKLPDKEDAPVR